MKRMAELKPMEVIMRIDFAASDKTQVCAHAEKIQELVRCQDCKYSRPYWLDKYTCEKEHDCGDYTVPFDWFCADGEVRGEEDESNA